MARVEQAGKNIKYSTIAYIINNLLKLVVRLVFVKALSIEYLGIHGLLSNILAMLSLAELGVGPAIVYSLYKPLAEKDTETIKALMALFRKAYAAIGISIIGIGVCIMPWLDWFIKSNTISDIQWFYFVFLFNTGISYFYSYKRNLLIADQKQYINSIYQSSGQIALAVLQIMFLLVYPSYLIYILLMLLVTVSENYAVVKKVVRVYPYLQEKNVQTLSVDIKNTIIKNVKAMIAHKIGGMAVFSTSNLILSKFVGLTAVALYSNYYLVISAVNNFAGQFFSSITASIGNLIVLESNQKKASVFKVIEFILAWQAMIVSCGFYVLLNQLIELWLGERFLFDAIIVNWLIVNFYLIYMRKAVNTFKDASGLYWNDRYKPLAEAVINLVAPVRFPSAAGKLCRGWKRCFRPVPPISFLADEGVTALSGVLQAASALLQNKMVLLLQNEHTAHHRQSGFPAAQSLRPSHRKTVHADNPANLPFLRQPTVLSARQLYSPSILRSEFLSKESR